MARTNIVLDDSLVEQGLLLSGLGTKKELVHTALEAYVQWLRQGRIRELRGKVEFYDGYDHAHLRFRRGDDS